MTDQTLELRIARREQQAHGIVVFDLVAPDGRALPPFGAGAHVDVHVAPGLVRQYSLCGSPSDTGRYRLGILLDPASRGGSTAIHAGFAEGGTVRVGLPRNQFPLDASAPCSVLIGGGIGVTPVLSMAHQLSESGRDFTLHYCARERDRAAFLPELDATSFRDHVRTHFDDGPAAQRLDPARDLPPPDTGAHLYVCGPTGFMDWVIAEAMGLGYPEARVHREYFTAEVDAGGAGFEVEVASSGQVVAVPDGTTIVQALATLGIKVEVSCEQGICGTCLCTVLDGIPEHRDTYLTDDEKAGNDQVLLCCSRSKSPRLLLDL